MKKIWLTSLLLFSWVLVSAQITAATETMAMVKFKVTDYNLLPEEDAMVSISGVDTVFTAQSTTNIQGLATIFLPEGKSYKITVNKFGEDFEFTKPLALPKVKGSIKFDHSLKIRIITEYVKIYTMEHVYFDNNKWDLKKESMQEIDNLLKSLKDSPNMKVEIAGHTDNVGEPPANILLSQKRADEVMHYLTNKGIAKIRILAKGYGEMVPLADNVNEAGRQKNRRTEVRIISE